MAAPTILAKLQAIADWPDLWNCAPVTDPNLGPISFLQGYLFYDTAEIWSFNAAPGAGELSLSSAGAGLRVNFEDWLTARLELARPLTRAPTEKGEKDWRQFFSLSAAY